MPGPQAALQSYQKGYENGRLRGAGWMPSPTTPACSRAERRRDSSRSFGISDPEHHRVGQNPLAISPSGRHFGLFQMGSGARSGGDEPPWDAGSRRP